MASVAPAWRATLDRASRAIWRSSAAHVGRRLDEPFGKVEADFDQAVLMELLGQGDQEADEVGPIDELGPQPEDESAELPDRVVQGVDRAIDARPRLGRILVHQLGHVLERERHGVHALDDAVVEVLADAVPLLDHGDAPDGLVQPGILDRNPGVQGEQLDEPLVVVAELGRAPPCRSDRSCR